MGVIPAADVPAGDDVIDAIAEIEMLRRETEGKAGLAMSCSAALHRLNELLDHEKEALRLRGPRGVHASNVDVLSAEIERVKRLALVTNQRPKPGRPPYPDQRGPSWRNAPQSPMRNKGRRTMGRGGGR